MHIWAPHGCYINLLVVWVAHRVFNMGVTKGVLFWDCISVYFICVMVLKIETNLKFQQQGRCSCFETALYTFLFFRAVWKIDTNLSATGDMFIFWDCFVCSFNLFVSCSSENRLIYQQYWRRASFGTVLYAFLLDLSHGGLKIDYQQQGEMCMFWDCFVCLFILSQDGLKIE